LCTFAVALRKESVDRNKLNLINQEKNTWSLSARRAWIEITPKPGKVNVVEVALRKESVDRNPY